MVVLSYCTEHSREVKERKVTKKKEREYLGEIVVHEAYLLHVYKAQEESNIDDAGR